MQHEVKIQATYPPWFYNHKPTKQVSLSVLHWSARHI